MTSSPTVAAHHQHQQQQQQLTPPIPPTLLNLPPGLSPDSIDIIPVLASILSRLQSSSPSSQQNPTTSSAGSPRPPAPPLLPAASPSQLASGTAPLTIKDIPTATDELKHKLQRARAQVRELPDVERSVEEQEVEIRELQLKIAEQRRVLQGFRGVGEQVKREGSADGMES